LEWVLREEGLRKEETAMTQMNELGKAMPFDLILTLEPFQFSFNIVTNSIPFLLSK